MLADFELIKKFFQWGIDRDLYKHSSVSAQLVDFELIKKIFQWGIDRNLYKYSSVPVQLVKLAEEFLEYLIADKEANTKKIEDALGDMQVVFLNLAGVELTKKAGRDLTADELVDALRKPDLLTAMDYAEFNGDIIKLVEHLIKKGIRNKMNSVNMFWNFIYFLDDTKVDHVECLITAYNEIKDRKGYFTPEGNFVKEEDK